MQTTRRVVNTLSEAARWTTIGQKLACAMHRMPLVPAAALVMAGIGLVEWLHITNVWLTLVPAALLMLAAAFALKRQRPSLTMSLLGFVLFWVGGTLHLWQRPPENDDLGRVAQRDYQPLVFRAEIISGAVWRPNSFFRAGQDESQRWSTQWKVHCTAVRSGGQWQAITSYSNLTVPGRLESFLPGDQLLVYGSFALIPEPTNPGQSDLRAALRQEHQFVFLQADSLAQLKLEGSSWKRPVSRWTAMAVRSIDRAIHRYVPLGQGPLAAALIFGQRQQVDWDAQQQLLSTGTLHMLAISGMHIELVAGSLWILCWVFGLKQRPSLLLVGTCITLYALIAGANPPVLRAVFVVLAVCVARWRGQRSGLANLLAFSGLAVLAMRSAWIGNVGVQLSFLAVAVIAIFSRGITGRSERVDALAKVIEESWSWHQRLLRNLGRWIWQMTVLSFWVWLLTAPLIWINFNVVSLVAIPLNILLWPLLVIGLLSGLVLSVTSWISPLAWLMGMACGVSLWLIGIIVWLGDLLPLGHVWLPAPSVGWISTFYALAAIGVLVISYRPQLRPALGLVLSGWLAIGMLPWLIGTRGHGGDQLRQVAASVQQAMPVLKTVGTWLVAQPADPPPVDQLRVTFIDVGHGTCVLMELPGGDIWLYDAGHLGGGQRSHQEIARVLWHLPTARIDRLFISHADADHYNAIPGLVQRFSIGEVVASPQFWQHLDPELARLRETLDGHSIPMTRLVAGDHMHSQGQLPVNVEVLHPDGNFFDPLDNANSLTLHITYGRASCLLPGDLERGGLQFLLSLPEEHCDLVMAPHHGSMTLDPLPLWSWCGDPKWIVISGGPRAAREKVLQRYQIASAETLVTHRDGAIQWQVRPEGLMKVMRWQKGQWRD